MELKEGIIIASAEIKKSILESTKDMMNYTFMSYEGLLSAIFGTVKNTALFALMREYGLSYDVANEYIKYIPYVEEKTYNDMKLDSLVSAKSYLKKNNLIEIDPYFIYSLKNNNITILEKKNTKQFNYVVEYLRRYTNVELLENDNKRYKPLVNNYSSIDEEVYSVCNEIKRLHSLGISYNNMHIVNANNDYMFLFERMLNSYNIPFYITKKGSILHTFFARRLLSLMKEKNTFREVYEELPESEFKAEVLALIIDYDLADCYPNDYIYFMERMLKSFSYQTVRYMDMVSFDNASFYNDSDYVFFVGLNQGVAPKIYKDEGYLNDKMLDMLNIPTSLEKNKEEKNKLSFLLTHTKNIYVSYPSRKGLSVLDPSNIISTLGLDIVKKETDYGYSKKEDSLRLAALLSIYDKTHEKNSALDTYSINDLSYKSFDNEYKGIDKKNMEERYNNEKPVSLSYSSMKTYYECPFHYYCDRILDLDTFESSTAARLGTYSHAILEDSYKDGFDFNSSVINNKIDVLKDLKEDIYAKDEFYFEQMKSVLSSLLEFNHSHEELTVFDNVDCEAHIEYLDGNLKFHGYIDKLMYAEINNEIYAAIVDYKTGKDYITLNNVWDGFHLQLPSYMFLLSNYDKFKGKKIHIIGIYLQKVNMIALDNTLDIDSQIKKSFMLQGYTIKDKSLITYIDPNYSKSDYIGSMSLVKSGDFGKYAKVITEDDEADLISIVNEKIHTAYNGIMSSDFKIAPKRINNKDQSCTYCKYKDICFKKAKDYVELEEKIFPKEVE